MISLKQVNKIMLKIFNVMEKINKFSNQMAGSGLSSDYSKEETKRKGKHEKHLDKLEQKKKRLQIEIDNIKKRKVVKKKIRKKERNCCRARNFRRFRL